ncbi:hypothetical protein ES705_10699 [subsurface metagenome]
MFPEFSERTRKGKYVTIIREAQLDLNLNHILRRQGIRGRSSRPEMVAITEQLLEEVKELRLLEPVFTYHVYPIAEIKDDQMRLNNGAIIRGKLLPSVLSKSKELATVVCTIGPQLEHKVTEYIKEGEPLRGLLLDGIGTAAIDTLTVQACKSLRQKALLRGNQASSPLSPGMPGFPISEQQTLLELASAEQIGVSLSSTGIMFPCKSTSAVIGIGPDMPTWTPTEVCAHCSLNKICPYRITAKVEASRMKLR